MKNCKTFYEAQRASRLKEIIKPPPTPNQLKSYYDSGTKIILPRYTEIYRHLLSKCFKSAALGRQKWCNVNAFSDTKQENVCWKICKVRKVFGCVAGAYDFQCQVS